MFVRWYVVANSASETSEITAAGSSHRQAANGATQAAVIKQIPIHSAPCGARECGLIMSVTTNKRKRPATRIAEILADH